MVVPTYAKADDTSDKSFEKMTDKYMEKVLNDYNVAGAAVSVVRDGVVLYQKGYGYADLENKVPVDAKTTSFQIASVSKVFTATAVMQMIEQGKLSLDEDINNYLTAFKIDNPYSNPVTLRTLLTHTSGLDFVIPLYVPSSGDILFDSMDSLENDLKDNLTPVVRNPGTFCQYNSYGIALAGYLVEIASGKPLNKYITEKVLEPLEMKHSSYGITDSVLPFMSKPYKYSLGKFRQKSYTLISNHPSGSICASASDMANFMLAHLNNGKFNAKRILNSDTAIAMHGHEHPEDDRLTGFSLGFYETIRNGYKTIEFGGYLPCFSSKISLLPDKNIGVFIAINTDSSSSSKVCNEYIDIIYKFFTDSQIKEVSGGAIVPFDMDAGELSGRYSMSEYGEKNISKIKSVLITCKVKCDNNGNLSFSSSELNWDFKYVGEGMFYCKENGYYCRLSQMDGKWLLNILGLDCVKVNTSVWLLSIISLICQPVFAVSILLLLRSFIRKRKQEIRLSQILKITLMLQAILTISYFALNAVLGFLYMAGDTSLIINVIQPRIPILCWSCVGIAFASTIILVTLWIKNQASLKVKIAISIMTVLYILNTMFMYLMNGMKF